MKTKIDHTDTSLAKETKTIFRFDKYPLVLLTEVKGTDQRGHAYSSRRLHADSRCKQHEYLKQLTLLTAKYVAPCDLPYAIDRGHEAFYEDTDAMKWANDLATSHNKQLGFLHVPKERFAEFEVDITAIEFRIYDNELSTRMTEKYALPSAIKTAIPAEIDAVAIEEDR